MHLYGAVGLVTTGCGVAICSHGVMPDSPKAVPVCGPIYTLSPRLQRCKFRTRLAITIHNMQSTVASRASKPAAGPRNRSMQTRRVVPSARLAPSRSLRSSRQLTAAPVAALQPHRSSHRTQSRGAFLGGLPVVQRVPVARQRRVVSVKAARSSAVLVQANLFARLYRVVKAYVDSFVGSFEDPEKLLDRVVDEMTQDAIRMRQASAQAIAAQKQMGARAQNMQATADQWLRRAELAVARGQDDLAREALMRRKAIQADADRLTEQAVAQQQAVDQLSASVRMLESKISEAKGKKETLKARAASAKTSIAIQEMIGGLRSESATSFAAFDKMEEKVLALESEAQGIAAMATPDNLEQRFALLEQGGGVEDELAALKANRGQQQALPRPRINEVLQNSPVYSAVDAELEELRRRARS